MDWGSIKHFIQIPLSWFRDVDTRSWIIGDGKRINVTRNKEGTHLSFDETGLGASSDVGVAVNHVDDSADDDQDGNTWNWSAGTDNGLIVDCYAYIPKIDGWHYAQRCRLTFSKDGLLVSASRLAGRKEIQS